MHKWLWLSGNHPLAKVPIVICQILSKHVWPVRGNVCIHTHLHYSKIIILELYNQKNLMVNNIQLMKGG